MMVIAYFNQLMLFLDDMGGKVYIFPALQLNMINIREDENLLLDVIKYIGASDQHKMEF